jgi:hypothetical protein
VLLPNEEALLFLRVYPDLIAYAARRAGGIQGIVDGETWQAAPMEAKAEARDHLLDHIDVLADYLDENPDDLSDEILARVQAWKHFVRGHFIVERDLKKYTVFLDTGEPPKAYAVLGLTTEIVEMLPVSPPAFAQAVLLPWKNTIICDGFLASYSIVAGGGTKRAFRDAYRKAKAAGIITTLPPQSPPTETTPRSRPKTPAIVRFLRKKCPRTIEEFVERFGEPRMDMANDAAREYSLWSIDGEPVLDIDHVMLYANIIKDQVLYVYAKGGKITHVAVVDPTMWSRRDFRPVGGKRLIR